MLPAVDTQSLPERVMTGLSKIGLALKTQAWRDSARRGISPLQAQALAVLRNASQQGLRLSALADLLGVADPTASEAAAALERKGLLRKTRADDDGRAVALTLTPAGRREAGRVSSWPDFLLAAVGTLSAVEQEVFLGGLTRMIVLLQQEGRIPVSRMCSSCRFFLPNVHDDPVRPHHCAFVDAPFGNRELRLDCPDFESLPTLPC